METNLKINMPNLDIVIITLKNKNNILNTYFLLL